MTSSRTSYLSQNVAGCGHFIVQQSSNCLRKIIRDKIGDNNQAGIGTDFGDS